MKMTRKEYMALTKTQKAAIRKSFTYSKNGVWKKRRRSKSTKKRRY